MPRTGTSRIERHGRRFRVTWWDGPERLRRTFDSYEEADRFLDALRSQQEGDAVPETQRLRGGLTVGEVVDNWYRDHKRNLSSGTQRDYEGRIKREVSRIGSLEANELARNPRALRAFYATLPPPTPAGSTPSSARPLKTPSATGSSTGILRTRPGRASRGRRSA